jgi:anti-sigma factor RsiW
MACNQESQVHRFHDGELSAGEAELLESHLGACAECRGLLAELRSLSLLIRQAAPAPLPAGSMERFNQSLPSLRERSLIRVASWLTATAAAVLIMALLRQPSGSEDIVAAPAPWETLAVSPPTDTREEASAELAVAQWMAVDLASGENGELR